MVSILKLKRNMLQLEISFLTLELERDGLLPGRCIPDHTPSTHWTAS